MAHRSFITAWIHAALLGCAALLAACSTPKPYPIQQHQSTKAWQGRLGLQVHDPVAQEQSFSASFYLQGSAERGSLDVFTPLGSQIAKLQWQPGAASLQQGDHITYSTSLDDLLLQSLGTVLPVNALFSWLQGLASNAEGWKADLSRHAEGRITAQRYSPLPQATLRVVLQTAD